MSLPGEEAAWRVVESPLSTSVEKAAARTKLAEIAEIRQRNLESEREYRQRQARQARFCPHCGGEL